MTQNKRPTIRTVAKYVDLSPTTVSLALRGDDSIPAETRNKVLAAAKELNYEFVPRKRKSERKRVKRVVYVIKDYGDQPVIANPFYGQILNGVEQACREADANLSFVVMPHEYPDTTELPVAITENVDGIIMSSPYPRSIVDRVASISHCPLVLVDNTFPGSPYDTVMADDYGGGYRVTEHLLEQGHRRIMVVTGLARSREIPPSFQERYRGYCAACTYWGIDLLPPAVVPEYIDISPSDRREPFQGWLGGILAEHPQVTAIFGVGDLFAIAALQSLQNLGYRIPADFSVVGYDNYEEMATIIKPPLTTIHSYKRAMGQVAVQRLLSRMEGDDTPPLYISVGANLVTRASTNLAPVREPSMMTNDRK
ncbi:MAG: hypothetical protein CL610_08635 [Anaerolineaceae bacterium]|nr:hypothetical protein [Anaerolineaceae bacterium]